MPQEYSWEVRQQAFDLYVMGGLTFEKVAEVTGVSISQLKRWSAEEKEWAGNQGRDGKDWPESRKEFRLAQGSAPREGVLLRAMLISNALASKGDFKTVLAASMWEKTQAGKDLQIAKTARGEVSGGSAGSEPSEALPVIKTPQDAVAALENLVNQKISLLATQPGQLNFANVKDLKQTVGLIEELKAKYQPDEKTGQAPGLSDEAADQIRRQILGVA